jgi:hypothetical protein
LTQANIEDTEWRGISIEKGQFVCSLKNMSIATGLTIQQIRTCINKLKSTHEITSKSTNDFTLITVCNYDNYQQQTTNEQHTNQHTTQQTNNKRITNEQQTNNKRITTDKEYNNIIKKEYKERKEETDFTPRTYARTHEEIEKTENQNQNQIDFEKQKKDFENYNDRLDSIFEKMQPEKNFFIQNVFCGKCTIEEGKDFLKKFFDEEKIKREHTDCYTDELLEIKLRTHFMFWLDRRIKEKKEKENGRKQNNTSIVGEHFESDL